MKNRRRIEATERIKTILKTRSSVLFSQIEHVHDIRDVNLTLREEIVEELADELGEKGLLPDSEPSPYGHELESLIDACELASRRRE